LPSRNEATTRSPDLIDAIHYAMRQKYAKAIHRSINLSGTALAAACTITLMAIGGVAAPASNPVGWGIAIGLIGVGTLIGLGLLAYKIGRYFHKKKKGLLNQRRREVANSLYDRVVDEPNHGAGRALSVLGLDPHEMHEPQIMAGRMRSGIQFTGWTRCWTRSSTDMRKTQRSRRVLASVSQTFAPSCQKWTPARRQLWTR